VSLGERILLAAVGVMILCFVAWTLAREAVVMNVRLQGELARCQSQAAAGAAAAPAPGRR
jgi:hypothetical protein